MSEQEFREKVFERLGDIDNRLKRDPVRTISLIVAALCLIAAGISAGVAVTSREALNDQRTTNQLLLCAQGRSVAAGATFRSQRGSETREQFLDRMLAQRFQLLALGSLDCPTLPGFDTFAFQRGKALNEINDILRNLAPRRYRKIIESEGGTAAAAGETGPQGSLAPSLTTASAPPELPSPSPPADGGGSGNPAPPGSSGDSPDGAGNPPSKSHPPANEGAGGDGGQEGGSESPASGAPPPPPPPPEQGGGGEESGGGSTASGEQSILSPALDNTCNLPLASKLLCTPR